MSEQAKTLIRQAIQTLTVPAAEYVPAIPEAWALLERALLALVQPKSKEQWLAETAETLERLDIRAQDRRERLGLGQPAVSEEAARDRWFGKLLTKLPPFDPEWDDDVRAGWHSCFENLMVIARAQSSKGDEGMQHE